MQMHISAHVMFIYHYYAIFIAIPEVLVFNRVELHRVVHVTYRIIPAVRSSLRFMCYLLGRPQLF